MHIELCKMCGFDADTIPRRITLVGLQGRESKTLAQDLQRFVIRPAIHQITDRFYDVFQDNDEFSAIVRQRSSFESLKRTQQLYLLSLGVDFDTSEYFEERLHIGLVHQKAGVSLSIYQCSYRLLQSLLIETMYQVGAARIHDYEAMVHFILKITTLDMSLALEAYYGTKIVNLEHSIDSMRGEGRQLRKMVRTDSLTGLCSRGYSMGILENNLRETKSGDRTISVIMADLDHFKKINDVYGHTVGDKVLETVASRILSGARESDVVGRIGGEEFLLILENTDLDAALYVAERIRLSVCEDPIRINDLTLNLTVSLGIAEAMNTDDVDSLITRADRALYLAKSSGRNTVKLAEKNCTTA